MSDEQRKALIERLARGRQKSLETRKEMSKMKAEAVEDAKKKAIEQYAAKKAKLSKGFDEDAFLRRYRR